MQKTIESFFNHSSNPPPSANSYDLFDGIRETKFPEIRIKYTRQPTRVEESTSDVLIGEEIFDEQIEKSEKFKGKNLNKKRKYAQFHLELGQSDFLLHTCKVCGIQYTKGDETDEKVHTSFHKNFTHGIPFKGWRQERLIHLPALKRDRIVVVSNCDPPAQKKKVQEVVKMMEIELGDGWIFHELCQVCTDVVELSDLSLQFVFQKLFCMGRLLNITLADWLLQVYLFISSQRVVGCLIVEPISTAHKLLSDSVQKISDSASGKEVIAKANTLQFGTIFFQREVSRKGSTYKSLEAMDSNLLGSIVCEEEATPASCGIRAIWVSPSNRRKHIATHLLDAVRKSFSTDYVLEHSQLAFSNPTSAGKALATNYTGTGSFLVYKT
ncbi:protein CHROMOSOME TRANSMISSION FIDELITY 7-like isoform X1 [Chenopodium quinoa]|uniref:protein CHROMOSOME TRANSMISSION FIDELITY 7-like isoform X1 n=1 Tax=Chenopodium quinoa TaxID=63459 RepID=UPI000B79024C|nr:protein CHROMOSOME TRANSMISSION FIDELITY 7-like isoform X1 [Chenopodium quinoa]